MSVNVNVCLFALSIVELHWLMFLYILKQTNLGRFSMYQPKQLKTDFSTRSNLVSFHLPPQIPLCLLRKTSKVVAKCYPVRKKLK